MNIKLDDQMTIFSSVYKTHGMQQNNYFQKMNIFHIIMNYTSSNAGTGKYNSTGK